jgi:pimeloyl-ACP methyl ester carboxylesterase
MASAATASDEIEAKGIEANDAEPDHIDVSVSGSIGVDATDAELEAHDASSGGGLLHRASRVARDPRVTGVLRAAPRVADFMVRTHRRSSAIGDDDSIVPVRPTVGLAAQAYVDEFLIAALRHPDLLPTDDAYEPAAADLDAARSMFGARGWLDHPAAYHEDPPAPDDLSAESGRVFGLGYEHITFTSGWEPHPGEPGRDRWLEHEANRTAHAWVAREPGRDHRTWMVCLHGFGMGQSATMDLRGFRVGHLHQLGVNVAVLVLPLHGARASGRVRGEDLMTIDMVDSLHGMAQATWDARRLIRWLRESQGAERIGVMGQSLGGLVASLVASLEPDLRCVVAGVPVVDLPDVFRRHSPPAIAERARSYGVLGEAADEVHRMVSPLALECLVPREGRYIYAGLGDRMSTFNHARRLWLHWDRPTLAAYHGGHVGFILSRSVRTLVDAAVTDSLGGHA